MIHKGQNILKYTGLAIGQEEGLRQENVVRALSTTAASYAGSVRG